MSMPLASTLTPNSNPWLLPEVAEAQLTLVADQLVQDAQGNPPAPFAAFHRAMRFLTTRVVEPFYFLDIGCGVGHYAHLIARHYPGIAYCGTDVSLPMIQRARTFYHVQAYPRLPEPIFMNCLFEDNRFESMNVVFVSQAIEMTDAPFDNLHLVFERAKRYVFLHRLRVPGTGEPSRRVIERTYLGLTAQNMEWNRQELFEIAGGYGEIIYHNEWDMMLTMIVEKP